MNGRQLATAALGALLLSALAPAPLPAAVRCSSATPLTLVGFDAAAGRALLALPAASASDPKRPPDLIEMILGAATAKVHRGAGADAGAGSIAPGAVVVAASCGANCIQPRVWRGGAWQILGEPLAAPELSVLHATYDRGGSPWLMLHQPGGASGVVRASAFQLDGLDWRPRGVLRVNDIGSPAVVPVPDLNDGIVSGTGLFTAGNKPGYWLHALPAVEPARHGELTPLGKGTAAYLAASGHLFFTLDRGTTWKRSTWTPWGTGLSPAFQAGKDYTVEAAGGGRRSPLAIVWFDRRVPAEPGLVLTTAGADGTINEITRIPATLAADGTRSEIASVLVADAGSWWLLGATCVGSADDPAIAAAVVRPGGRPERASLVRLVD